MKTQHTIAVLFLFLFSSFIISSCKTKKLAAKPDVASVPAVTPAKKTVAVQQPVSTVASDKASAIVITKPELNFKRIQFDFNSAVLKTGSIQFLDRAAALIKKYPGYRFILKGYASAEGTAQHNLLLSEERANAVKSYLVNDGIDQSEFKTKGYGEAAPIASNQTESGKETNRRVEFSLAI